jgi:hypothetical protein
MSAVGAPFTRREWRQWTLHVRALRERRGWRLSARQRPSLAGARARAWLATRAERVQ